MRPTIVYNLPFVADQVRYFSLCCHSNFSSVIMSLAITDSKIGMAYAFTPRETTVSSSDYDFFATSASSNSSPIPDRTVHNLEPIIYMQHTSCNNDSACTLYGGIRSRRKRETMRVAEEIKAVVDKIRANAFLVTWPLNTLSGKPGRDCGTVLHVLDAMTGPIITKSKPCMLWDYNREERLSLVCSKFGEKAGPNPLSNWLLTEKILRKNLKRIKIDQNETTSVHSSIFNRKERDEAELALVALQDFIDLNWPLSEDSLSSHQTNDKAEVLGRNHLLNGSFQTMEDPQEAQLRLLM
jgi:hypothetical protein